MGILSLEPQAYSFCSWTHGLYTQRQIDKLTPAHNLPGTRSGNNKLQKQLVYLCNAHNIHTCVNVYKCTQLNARRLDIHMLWCHRLVTEQAVKENNTNIWVQSVLLTNSTQSKHRSNPNQIFYNQSVIVEQMNKWISASVGIAYNRRNKWIRPMLI